jgi:hypothetical protein
MSRYLVPYQNELAPEVARGLAEKVLRLLEQAANENFERTP